ncbi:MAG: fatty acid cis/trans isomerase [Nitrospiraceae bacterium]
MNLRWTFLMLAAVALVSCSQPSRPTSVEMAEPGDRAKAPGIASVEYWRDVKPILERRCAVCHGCYDAPCQLNLSAFEGIARGAHTKKVYDTTRLISAEPTRLFDDARSVAEWRKKGFFPVLSETSHAGGGRPQAGVMARMLALKREHPLPAVVPLPATFDFSLDRNQQCPAEGQFDNFASKYPLWGMPYGLPALTEREQSTVMRWLEDGAPYREPDPPPQPDKERIREWEAFLNGDASKHRLMSRYLYEHLYLASLYFDDLSNRQYFRLVRSRSAPDRPIDMIATRRPYDDPGSGRFYYRLQPIHASLLVKTHIPYALSPARKQRYTELFLEAKYDVPKLPTYDPRVAANPFVAFHDLPVSSRYRFLLDDAGLFIMMFIKGPSCRGQVALDVIDDRFWIFFVDPDSALLERSAEFLARESKHLRLPTEGDASRLVLVSWLKYSRLQRDFLKAKQAYMEKHRSRLEPNLGFIWDGNGRNKNASLTVFRHADSASVVQGLVGANPKTAVLLSYQLLERIYYLLVAGFDVYGYLGHLLDTRLYMDFLRMEGEFNFLVLLPKQVREKERDFWYRDAHESVKEYVYGSRIQFDYDTGIEYRTDDPKSELFALLRQRLAGALNTEYDLGGETDAGLRTQLEALSRVRGRALAWLPEVAFVAVTDDVRTDIHEDRVYTLIHDTGYSNITSLFDQEARRLPDEDGVTVTRGFVGAYPNAFYRVQRSSLPQFVAGVTALTSEEDYQKFADRFAVRRTNPDFWRHSDQLHQAYSVRTPLEAGVFDFNRLENR